MANLHDIRQRIKATRSMGKITKAMQMVAISKMKHAQQAALDGIPYADMLNDILTQVTRHVGAYRHGLMEERNGPRKLNILVGTDRGLCGSLNTNIFREVAGDDPRETLYVTLGSKAAQFVRKTGRQLIVDFDYGDPPKLSQARLVCRFVTQLFLDDEIDSANIIFSNFVSTFKQMPDPVKRTRIADGENSVQGIAEFDFEPDVHTVYESLLLHTLDHQLLQIMREVRASEHSARMVSMKQASDNAKEMDEKLQLIHNNLRQASITAELLELGSAAGAEGS
jgi:F-type H+-transporting ATPase subunit gamma